jgi:phosphatidate cytidylyltransferase
VLKRRLIAAAIIISTMIFLLWIDFQVGTPSMTGRPGVILCLLAILTSGFAASELWQMFHSGGGEQQPQWLVVATMVGTTAIVCGPVLYSVYPMDCPVGKFGWPFVGLLLAVVLSFLYEMLTFDIDQTQDPGVVTHRISRAVLIYAYLTLLFAFLTAHRFLNHDNHLGQIALVTLLSTVKLSDSFAFFTGRRLGTIKLAPKLSPGKTVQGSLGALVGGCVAVAINVFLVAPLIYGVELQLPWWWIVTYGVVVAVAGMLGDLAESLVKRDCQSKDSSTWLKGLGGILDIVDSLVFAAPISWLLWMLVETAA